MWAVVAVLIGLRCVKTTVVQTCVLTICAGAYRVVDQRRWQYPRYVLGMQSRMKVLTQQA